MTVRRTQSSVIVDANLHLGDLDDRVYGAIGPEHGVLHRSYRVADAAPELRAAGVDKAVLVQVVDDRRDTDAMLSGADAEARKLPSVIVCANVLRTIFSTDFCTADAHAVADGGAFGLRTRRPPRRRRRLGDRRQRLATAKEAVDG